MASSSCWTSRRRTRRRPWPRLTCVQATKRARRHQWRPASARLSQSRPPGTRVHQRPLRHCLGTGRWRWDSPPWRWRHRRRRLGRRPALGRVWTRSCHLCCCRLCFYHCYGGYNSGSSSSNSTSSSSSSSSTTSSSFSSSICARIIRFLDPDHTKLC